MTRPQAPSEDLVYWIGEDVGTPGNIGEDSGVDDSVDSVETEDTFLHGSGKESRPESIYVTLFERMTRTVLKDEAHLLSPDELICLETYTKLSYRARFLLVRLILRKQDKIHRLGKLTFQSELGPHIPDAIRELCYGQNVQASVKGHEIIDLTGEDDDSSQEILGPLGSDLTYFAEDESSMNLDELLQCLSVDEINSVARELRLKVPQSHRALVVDILRYTSTQGVLSFPATPVVAKAKLSWDGKLLRQSLLSFAPRQLKSAVDPVRQIVLKILEKCIRVNPDITKFFRRLNIIFFRDTQLPDKILTPSLLARVKKRYYPSYGFTRTADIWKSRDDLLQYEKALELGARLQEYLDGSSRDSVGRTSSDRVAASLADGKGGIEHEELWIADGPSPRVRAARSVKTLFESVYQLWKEMITACASPSEDVDEQARARRGLSRFECGYVYTRIVQRGTEALGILKEYEYELEVLEMLLSQRRWRRGSRGAWHDRRALIFMTHLKGKDGAIQRALDAVTDGLKDDDTHTIYRLRLERRLTVLQKRLKIPEKDRHVCLGQLVKPAKVFIEGIRVKHNAANGLLDSPGHQSMTPERTPKKTLLSYGMTPSFRLKVETGSKENLKQEKEAHISRPVTGKSIWVGNSGEEVTVEMFALQEYEIHGYKGFHCEGRILTTLFGLLFWDVLFANVPGTLETPWQSAPLDIAEDSFYFSRKEIINERLAEIAAGRAATILAKFDDLHRENKTWCVGVRWDLFSKQDLAEIVDCIGDKQLSIICRLLAEDYASRTSGVPDLIVWNYESHECKFVEVKGPGDSERDNQKVWMDALLRAGVPTEVCRIEERGYAEKMKDKKSKKSRNRSKSIKHETARCLEDDLGKINSCDPSTSTENIDFGLEPQGSKRRVGEDTRLVVSSRPSKRQDVRLSKE